MNGCLLWIIETASTVSAIIAFDPPEKKQQKEYIFYGCGKLHIIVFTGTRTFAVVDSCACTTKVVLQLLLQTLRILP